MTENKHRQCACYENEHILKLVDKVNSIKEFVSQLNLEFPFGSFILLFFRHRIVAVSKNLRVNSQRRRQFFRCLWQILSFSTLIN